MVTCKIPTQFNMNENNVQLILQKVFRGKTYSLDLGKYMNIMGTVLLNDVSHHLLLQIKF